MKFPRTWSELMDLLDATVETKIKHLLGTIFVAFCVFGLIFYMVESNGNRDLSREERANDVQTYQAELRIYDTQVAQVVQCNNRFDSRQAAKALFISQNNSMRNILNIISAANPNTNPNSPILLSLFAEVDAQDARIGIEYPPDEVNECNALPAPPVVPRSLVGAVEDETGDRPTTPPTTP